ncbi:MAG TPA: ERCC4 domain-containing protein [Gaiellaceae bacterium]|nr:ERCC4 domain-containing protein [Gaiellaceae bacterium]
MEIVVDVHERRSGVPAALAAIGVDVRLRTLPVGDYAIDELALIERKSVTDLHVSLIQGRLWQQLGRLRRAAPWRYLLVEGKSVYDGPLPQSAVRGLMVAVDDLGVAVIRSLDHADSAAWIERIARRRRGESRRVDRPPYAQRPQRPAQVSPPERALAAAEGVSTVTARKLLEEFGSLTNVLLAPPDALQRVDGVGVQRAESIRRLAQSN